MNGRGFETGNDAEAWFQPDRRRVVQLLLGAAASSMSVTKALAAQTAAAVPAPQIGLHTLKYVTVTATDGPEAVCRVRAIGGPLPSFVRQLGEFGDRKEPELVVFKGVPPRHGRVAEVEQPRFGDGHWRIGLTDHNLVGDLLQWDLSGFDMLVSTEKAELDSATEALLVWASGDLGICFNWWDLQCLCGSKEGELGLGKAFMVEGLWSEDVVMGRLVDKLTNAVAEGLDKGWALIQIAAAENSGLQSLLDFDATMARLREMHPRGEGYYTYSYSGSRRAILAIAFGRTVPIKKEMSPLRKELGTRA